MQTTYDKFPEVTVQGYDDQAWQGWESLCDASPQCFSRLQNRAGCGLLSRRPA